MINIEKIKVDVAGRGHITNAYIIYDDVVGGVSGRDNESYVTKGQWLCFSLRNKVNFV